MTQPTEPTPPAPPTPAPPSPPPSSPTPPAPPPAPPAPTPPPMPPAPSDQGFPANTPLVDMTTEQQLFYWKFHARKHEDTVRARADYDELKAKAAEADRLRQERESDTEKALREATEQARKTTMDELRPQLVSAEFRAASAGRIDAERLATLTEDIDLARYLKADGAVDLDKVKAKVAAWAPTPDPTDRRGPKPDPSQGSRGTKTSGTDVGRDMFDARRGRKQPAS